MLLRTLHFILLRFVTWLGAFSQERQELWLPKDDLRDSSSWSSPPFMLLRDIHSKLLNQFDCKEVCASFPSQVNTGASGGLSSQDGVPQEQERPSVSRRSTASLRFPLCGMRALPPTLTLLQSPHSIGSPNSYSATGSPSRISNLCLRVRAARNS
jgi:hypothetical protein